MNREINFSLWLDFIERGFLQNGEFDKLINNGIINGATSNPAIFQASFTNSKAYIEKIAELKKDGKQEKEIYEELAIEDIKLSAEKLLPLYKDGNMGFVSIEVDPFFANSADETIAEGVRLFEKIGFPNVMIKIPATEAGYIAMEELFRRDIPVNATLIFSLEEAIKSGDAMKRGLESSKNRSAKGVLSVFVSRLDKATSSTEFGIVNSDLIYKAVEKRGYENITTLFASTGVKDPNLPEDYYIRKLIAKNTVNTAPLKTIEAYVKSGMNGVENLPLNENYVGSVVEQISKNYNIDEVLKTLKKDGLEAFEKSFSEIMEHLKK
jgi:transaldolase